MKKLLLNENQLTTLTNYLVENNATKLVRNQIHNFLTKDYEAIGGIKMIANEFFDSPLIRKKVDGSELTPKSLLKYVEHKFSKVPKNVLVDAIKGWYHDDFDSELGMRQKK